MAVLGAAAVDAMLFFDHFEDSTDVENVIENHTRKPRRPWLFRDRINATEERTLTEADIQERFRYNL